VLTRHARTRRYGLGVAVQEYLAYQSGRVAMSPEEALDLGRERARLTRAQADRAEFRRDVEAGRLIQEADARRALEHVLVPLRQGVLELEVRLPPLLQAAQGPAEQRAILAEALRSTLSRLARPEIRSPEEEVLVAEPELDGLLADPPGQPTPAASRP